MTHIRQIRRKTTTSHSGHLVTESPDGLQKSLNWIIIQLPVRKSNTIQKLQKLQRVLVAFGDGAQSDIFSWGPKSLGAPLAGITVQGEVAVSGWIPSRSLQVFRVLWDAAAEVKGAWSRYDPWFRELLLCFPVVDFMDVSSSAGVTKPRCPCLFMCIDLRTLKRVCVFIFMIPPPCSSENGGTAPGAWMSDSDSNRGRRHFEKICIFIATLVFSVSEYVPWYGQKCVTWFYTGFGKYSAINTKYTWLYVYSHIWFCCFLIKTIKSVCWNLLNLCVT